MTFPEILAVVLVAVVCLTVMAGFPVAFTLGGVSLAFALFGHLFCVFALAFLGAFPQRVFATVDEAVRWAEIELQRARTT